MSKFIAQFISSVVNPLLILAVLPYLLVIKATGDASKAYFWTVFSLVFIFIVAVFILIGVEKKYFSDLDVSNRKQRPLLYYFAIATAAVYLGFLYFLKAPEILFIALFGVFFGLISMEFINRITKASLHTATVSAFTTALTLGFGPIYLFSFILIPIVAWARIKTHNHTKRQTLIGSCMGILITLCVYVIFKYVI